MTQAVEPLKQGHKHHWVMGYHENSDSPCNENCPLARPSCIKFCQPLLCLLFIYKRMLCNLARLSTPKWTIFWRLPSWIKLVPPPKKKNHSYLDSGTWNMDPPKRCWSGNVWKRVPLSNVDNFRSPPWSVENDLESMTTDMFFILRIEGLQITNTNQLFTSSLGEIYR